MWRRLPPPPPSLQYVVVSAATDSSATAAMSRPQFRGRGGRGQWRGGFSNRPYSSSSDGGGRGGPCVTGDSSLRSVRHANTGFRQGDTGTVPNQTGYHAVPPPPFNHNNQFRRPPPLDHNQPYRNNQQFQPHQQYRPNQQFQPRQLFRPAQQHRPQPQKPSDYRKWEYAKTPLPHNSEKFVVLSYNLLADYLASNHRYKLYYHIPRYMMDWNWRKKNLIFELGLWSADIMCFQEVDRFQELKEELKVKGYDGVWKMRTGNPVDGCAVFWRSSRFKLLHEECIEFSKLGLRDNVAQICVLESLRQTLMENNAALPASFYSCSPPVSDKVVICNIHVLYNPRRGEIKIGQVRVLLDKARAVSKIWNDAPIVLCGDFNCTPKSPLYNFISEQKLDVSGVDRDKVSGQASAEINSPRSYNPNYRGHAQGSTIVEGKEDEKKLNGLTLDLQNPNNSESSVEDAQLLNKESQPQCKNTRDVSCKSCINVHYGKDDSGHDAEANKDAKQNTVDIAKVDTESAFHAQGDGLKEDPSTSCVEGDFAADNLNDEIHRGPDLSSDSEKDSEVTEIECKDMDFTSNANDDSNIRVKESMNCVRENDSSRQGSNSNYRDNFNSEIPLSDVSGQTSFAGNIEGQPLGSLGDLPSKPFSIVKEDTASSPYQVNTSGASTSVDLEVQKNMENLSLTEFDEAVPEGEMTAEDDSTFLSALHNSRDGFASESSSNSPNNFLPVSINEIEDGLSPGLDSETVDLEIAPYDPTLWTPMDIETATGNGECTLVEHPLKLRSTYTEVEDCTGTRDSNGEPLVTSYNKCFLGTVDYIWRSEGLQTVRVLAPIPKHAMQWTSGFPTRKWGSDHIALASELVFVNSSNLS